MGLKRVAKVVRVVRKIDKAMSPKRGLNAFQECMKGKAVGTGNKAQRNAAFAANARSCSGRSGGAPRRGRGRSTTPNVP